MLDFIRFAIRNPSYVTRNARKSWDTRKAMDAYREKPGNDCCAYCGRDQGLHVHHIVPVSVAPELAADPTNFIMLCGKGCHLVIGHEGHYGGRYVENVRELCQAQKVVRVVSE